MKGIHLRSLTGELHHVAPMFENDPVLEIDADQKLAFCQDYIESRHGEFSFKRDFYKLPLRSFKNFSFDELCKLKYSTIFTMEESVSTLFDTQPKYEVVRKIKSSMWRWGHKTGTWNEVVDVWNCIRRFDLNLNSDFEIRLDYTTGYNDYGYSKYSRTFIDGVFAFLVYYKRTHVMTIGFSVTNGRRILIQQVQLRQQSKNRWLYSFPKNRMEFVIDSFATHFPGFKFCIIDGQSLAKKTIASYERGMQRAQERVERYQQYVETESSQHETRVQENKDEVETFRARIAHLRNDVPRLAGFYRNCGRHSLGKTVDVNALTHHQLSLRG